MRYDLRDLALYLREVFKQSPAVGAVVGRTSLRDAVAQKLNCSQLEAEQQIDEMVALSLLVFDGEHGEPGRWHIRPDAQISE